VTLTLVDFFCGAGGSSQGAVAVPGVSARLAANHWQRAIDTHAANFPHTEHFRGDLHAAAVEKFPAGDLFWASPECPAWSVARGRQRDFDRQPDLFGEVLPDEAADRSRALMWDVPRYLEAMALRGAPVRAGVVENVPDVRAWSHWHAWRTAIENLGYRTRLVALNSMHARPRVTPAAPQSRDRLYLAYWAASLRRDPDWGKWLRPPALCPACGQVRAVQWWKRPGADMGRYRQQYLYRCPLPSCGRVVEPEALPAAAAIDWTLRGTRIGDRAVPLRPKTLDRIRAGLDRYARPLMVPAGGTWRTGATPVTDPMPARTTRENDALAVPADGAMVMRNNTPHGDPGQMCTPASEPLRTVTTRGHQSLITWDPLTLVVPVEGRDGKTALPASAPMRTQTARAETGIAAPDLLVPYYSTGTARPVSEPVGTLTATDRYALAQAAVALDDVLFRMLEPHEIAAAMAFAARYTVLGTKREKVRQLGNAVTPPAAEILIAALVEAVTGEER
jgi:DNA (cytosine-5)-methyltransferase 1